MVDTARIYQHTTPDGDTETVLGELFDTSPSLMKRTHLATKANPAIAPHKSLSKESVVEQCNTSLQKLGVDFVDLFYLHMPDIKTDIDDTLSGIDQLHKEGKIKEFGLSNYPAWAVVDIWHRCKNRGIVLPTVYQGMYNVITRNIEPEIVPVLRQFKMRFYVYNPLAGGLLTGRYASAEDIAKATEGRFSQEFDRGMGVSAGTVMYRNRFGKQALFEGLKVIREAIDALVAKDAPAPAETPAPSVEETVTVVNGMKVTVQVTETGPAAGPVDPGLNMVSVVLRWLLHHSCLTKGDGIILGASKTPQLITNLAAWKQGPLPPSLVEACNTAWEVAKPAAEPYFRGYGAQPGGIENFLKLKAEEAGKEDQKMS